MIYVNASFICSDYYIWLDHLVLFFHPCHFTDGKSEAWGREVPGQLSQGESQAEWTKLDLQAPCIVLFQLHQNSI